LEASSGGVTETGLIYCSAGVSQTGAPAALVPAPARPQPARLRLSCLSSPFDTASTRVCESSTKTKTDAVEAADAPRRGLGWRGRLPVSSDESVSWPFLRASCTPCRAQKARVSPGQVMGFPWGATESGLQLQPKQPTLRSQDSSSPTTSGKAVNRPSGGASGAPGGPESCTPSSQPAWPAQHGAREVWLSQG